MGDQHEYDARHRVSGRHAPAGRGDSPHGMAICIMDAIVVTTRVAMIGLAGSVCAALDTAKCGGSAGDTITIADSPQPPWAMASQTSFVKC